MLPDYRYMPILKWKQGERLALRNLSSEHWERVLPLVELQAIDAAPDKQSIAAALPEYLSKTAANMVGVATNGQSLCIDTSYLSPGYPKQINLLLIICKSLQAQGVNAIPVIPTTMIEAFETLSAAQKDFFLEQSSLIVRLRVDQLESSQVKPSVESLISAGFKKRNLHLLIDQYSLVDREHEECVKNVVPYIDSAIKMKCANVIVGGGSFPINLVGKKQGHTDISRVEWLIWQQLRKLQEYDGLKYADYAVTNPAPAPEIDPREMNPSVAIRYATQDFWRLYKGGGFKKGRPGEYRNLCKLLTTDTKIYSGEKFSYGDSQYKNAASGGEKNGNPSSWRKEATNHHIVLTATSL